MESVPVDAGSARVGTAEGLKAAVTIDTEKVRGHLDEEADRIAGRREVRALV